MLDSEEEEEEEEEDDDDEKDEDEDTTSSSSSSSSSTSGSSPSEDDDVLPGSSGDVLPGSSGGGAGPPPPPPPAPPVDRSQNVAFGKYGRLTYFEKGFADSERGWQMTCSRPGHKVGKAKCTKTMAISVAGSEENIRMLKFWHVCGDGLMIKAEHKSIWNRVLEQNYDDTLPNDDELDRIVDSEE